MRTPPEGPIEGRRDRGRRLGAAAGLSLALVLSSSPGLAETAEPAAKGSGLEGKVLSAETGAPTQGAVVTAVHLETGGVFTSLPTARDGRFHLMDLPYGYYEIAIEAGGVLYAATAVVNAPPGRRGDFDLRLRPPGGAPNAWSSMPPGGISIPGLDRPASGIAEIPGATGDASFFTTPLGITTLVGGAVLMLYLVY